MVSSRFTNDRQQKPSTLNVTNIIIYFNYHNAATRLIIQAKKIQSFSR